jgi:hypothetical protein
MTDEKIKPVAWMVYAIDGQSVYVTDNPTDIKLGQRALPLYTEEPKREWVGLTGVEINHILAANVGYPERMMKDVENLLKEKNNG